jgi:glycosyltransferase involved in cell wall biosynthesis
MKILLLHDYGTATGGAELQILSLRQGLLQQGHEVRLFSSSALPVRNFPQLADYTCFGATSRVRVLAQTANVFAYWRLRQILREFQPDVVHLRIFLTQLSPLVLPLLQNIPCIYQTAMYGAICPKGTNTLPDGQQCQFSVGRACLSSGCLTPQSWAALMVQHRFWQRWRGAIDQIVALSHGMKQELEQAGLSPVDVIYNGVPVRSPRPPLTQPPTVAYAGRLVPEKGVDVLLQAFAIAHTQVPDAQLLIAGQGSAEGDLRQLAGGLGIADRVHWLGHCTRADMENRFNQAWVQVVPSRWAEPFGNVTTEAMMRGTAVIASAVGAQPEIVQPDQTGFLIPPGAVDALAESLTKLLLHQDLAEAMGAVGRDRALTHFSEERRNDQFLALYRRLQAQYAPISSPAIHSGVSST